jgi:hypothetical protein
MKNDKTNGRAATYTKDGELVGKFRKIDGGWEGYVIRQDGYATLIMISDGTVNSTQSIED